MTTTKTSIIILINTLILRLINILPLSKVDKYVYPYTPWGEVLCRIYTFQLCYYTRGAPGAPLKLEKKYDFVA